MVFQANTKKQKEASWKVKVETRKDGDSHIIEIIPYRNQYGCIPIPVTTDDLEMAIQGVRFFKNDYEEEYYTSGFKTLSEAREVSEKLKNFFQEGQKIEFEDDPLPI